MDLTNLEFVLNTLIICLIILKIMALFLIYLRSWVHLYFVLFFMPGLEAGYSLLQQMLITLWSGSFPDFSLKRDCFSKFGCRCWDKHRQTALRNFFSDLAVAMTFSSMTYKVLYIYKKNIKLFKIKCLYKMNAIIIFLRINF